MTITLGRVGTDGISLQAPKTVGFQGRQVTLDGVHSSTSSPEVLWLREQIIALADNDDEPVIPLTCTERPELDGFYRVAATTATHADGALGGPLAWLTWQVQLEQIRDFRQPRMETRGVVALLANSLGLLCDILIAVPSATLDWNPGMSSGSTGTRTASDGVVSTYDYVTTSTTGTVYTGQFSLPPASYYVGGCKAQFNVDGAGAWRTVIGRRAFTSVDLRTTNAVRFDNGLVRVTPKAGVLSVEWFNGTTWSTPTDFALWGTTTHNAQVAHESIIVVRSSPEEVALQIQAIPGTGNVFPWTLDLSLRRGQRNVFGKLATQVSFEAETFQLRFASTVASTSTLGALFRTANNGDGNREILISDTATTKDTTNGRITQPATASSMLFGIGCEIGGTGAVGGNLHDNQIREWFAALSETQRVVGR